METASSSAAADEEGPETANKHGPAVVEVAADGDLVLEVTFEAARSGRAAAVAGTQAAAYRVAVEALSRHSRYFAQLLANKHFGEARLVSEAHSRLARAGARPAQADAAALPVVKVVLEDRAGEAGGRERAPVLEDMLRAVHQQPPRHARPAMSYALTLAIMADRFDCAAAVARALNSALRFKWPVTSDRPLTNEAGHPTQAEPLLRQKILVSWLLGQALRLQHSTKELVVRGSRLWSAYDGADGDAAGPWWNLPDGIEDELRFRRECILDTISSVQRHFLALYSSRDRQCKLGYDTSAACDVFQLGQLHRFLRSKELLFLVDCSPSSLDAVPDMAHLDLDELVATLKQCPNYQVDKHHVNCGPRLRMRPILDYIRTMLSANVVWISHAEWKKRRAEASWAAIKDKDCAAGDEAGRTFFFTRAIANDERLRYDGAMHVDRMALSLFTAHAWDWTPED